MPFTFKADHIANAQGGFEPQRLNHFTIRISGLGASDVIESSLSSFQPPTSEVGEVIIPYGNEDRKVAGKVTVSEAQVVITDYVDQDTWAAFMSWRNQVYNPETGAIGLARDYKKEATVILFGPDQQVQRRWTLIGTWPRSVSPDQFSMDSAEPNKLTVPLSVDKFIPERGGAPVA